MHILIIPSEEYIPKHAPIAGIFQHDQAKILQQKGHQVGVLSFTFKYSFSSLLNALLGKKNKHTKKLSIGALLTTIFKKTFAPFQSAFHYEIKDQIDGQAKYVNLLMNGASSNKLINEVMVNSKVNHKTIKTIAQSYKNAPYFRVVMSLLESYFLGLEQDIPISKAAGESIMITSDYLGLHKVFEYSSENYSYTKNYNRADRLIQIAKENNAKTYINAEGGKELYTKEYFAKQGIELSFIKNNISEYQQFNKEFTPYLSIIDVMMFNSPEKIREMLDDYELE